MYIKRSLEDTIQTYLHTPEILIILGPRQSGKSTLLHHIHEKLKNANFISFEDIDILNLFETDIKSFARLYVEPFRYLCIDEIQYAQNFGKNMKFLYDKYKDKIKFLLTGSSATNFYLRGLKYLVGRAFTFHLYPFSFKEFLSYKNSKLISVLDSPAIQPQVHPLLEEFVILGGYPRVVLAESDNEKIMVLKNIYNLHIQREIATLSQLAQQTKIITLIRLLALQTANVVNYTALAGQASIKNAEIKGLLSLLENTFILKLLPPFYTNKRLEIVKNPKSFFIDTGLLNAVLNNFSTMRPDLGALYENFVFSELLKKNLTFRYWRTKSKAEVDFVVESNGTFWPLEVKYGQAAVSRSFRSFLERYAPPFGIILNNKNQDEIQIGQTKVSKKFFSEIVSL